MPRCLRRCEFDAGLFLCVSNGGGSTSWRFLDELTTQLKIPSEAIQLVEGCNDAIMSLAPIADDMRASGMLGHHQEVLKKIEEVREKRFECLANYCLPDASMASAAATKNGHRRHAWDAAAVAAELHSKHYCVLEKFLETTALRALLRSMKDTGELQPGEVSGGLKKATRGDLMAWVSTSHGEQPAPLFDLLARLDELIGALGREPLCANDLGNGRLLVRHEMQCTCYPGNGARYVRHVDDALQHRGRRLTCIVYANPEWEAAHGGQIRLYVKRDGKEKPVDVAPLDGRLLLFWSDSRCPHEVLPAHKERYAVSVWISDAATVAEAAVAERAA